MVNSNPSIFIVAGEASGDMHGANLIKALKAAIPGVKVAGIGGPKMREAGLECLYAAEKLAVVGLTEVITHLKDIWLARQRARRFLSTQRPDLFIPIDYPDFNFGLAAFAKKLGIPVLYYISPQVWAWRRNRVKKIAKIVDKMAVILPFEEEFYRRYGINATFVGHPLLDIMPPPTPINLVNPTIGLLPGSRRSEIKHILPLMLETASILHKKRPVLKFVLPVAPTLDLGWLKQFVHCYPYRLPLSLEKASYELIQRCSFLLVASGTATLETAILERPFVVIYRLSTLSYLLGRMLVKVPYIGLVNWVAGEKIIPEFIQEKAKPALIAQYVLETLANQEKIKQIKDRLKRIRQCLGSPGVAQRVAQLARELVK